MLIALVASSCAKQKTCAAYKQKHKPMSYRDQKKAKKEAASKPLFEAGVRGKYNMKDSHGSVKKVNKQLKKQEGGGD